MLKKLWSWMIKHPHRVLTKDGGGIGIVYNACGEGDEEGEADIPRMMSFFHGNGTDLALAIP